MFYAISLFPIKPQGRVVFKIYGHRIVLQVTQFIEVISCCECQEQDANFNESERLDELLALYTMIFGDEITTEDDEYFYAAAPEDAKAMSAAEILSE